MLGDKWSWGQGATAERWWGGRWVQKEGSKPPPTRRARSQCKGLNSQSGGQEHLSSVHFSSITQLCLTACDPMDCSTPGHPVHHQLPEFPQTHVHWVGDAIQPSHPLSSPSPLAFNLSQHQCLFKRDSSSLEHLLRDNAGEMGTSHGTKDFVLHGKWVKGSHLKVCLSDLVRCIF